MLDKPDDIIMIEKVEEIALLLHKHLKGELSSDDKVRLDAWTNQSEQNRLIFLEISNEDAMMKEIKEYYELLPQIEEIRQRHAAQRASVINMFSKKTTWPRWVAAASVILLIATGTYFFLVKQKTGQVATDTKSTPTTHDIPPATNKAVLTLSNGSHIVLDSTNNGVIAHQDKTIINKKQDGELVYTNPSLSASELLYNTVSTPRGGKYQLTLPDGSKVWLNAASSLHFPIAFTGSERKVELTGEAYFEVVHNESKPFKVAMMSSSTKEEQGEVTVLGTHFNANSYVEEPDVKVTLLEGSVKVSKFLSSKSAPAVKFIKPGQQATFNKASSSEGINVINKDDPESAIAWINGRFSFENASFGTMMRELSRWYDVDVVYEGAVPTNTIVGEVDRTIPLSELLATVEKMGNTHFKIEGRKIKVIR